ncbi:MAG: hypothetical protein HOP00_01220 [Nitrospira sp.]|nr:hypothetical protein [Nitrospira sp.]
MAINYYENALGFYPQYALTHAQFGKYLSDMGKIKLAIEHLSHAVEMDRKLAPAFAWLAEAQYKNNNLELAKKAGIQARALGYKGEFPYEGSTGMPKK